MMPLSMLQKLVPSLQLQQCEQHSLIFSRDDDATTFYVVLSGACYGLACYACCYKMDHINP